MQTPVSLPNMVESLYDRLCGSMCPTLKLCLASSEYTQDKCRLNFILTRKELDASPNQYENCKLILSHKLHIQYIFYLLNQFGKSANEKKSTMLIFQFFLLNVPAMFTDDFWLCSKFCDIADHKDTYPTRFGVVYKLE